MPPSSDPAVLPTGPLHVFQVGTTGCAVCLSSLHAERVRRIAANAEIARKTAIVADG